MKLATLAYCPPFKGYPCAEAFWNNLHQFKTRWPLMLFSDAKLPGVIGIRNPESMPAQGSFRSFLDFRRKYPFAINNVLWLTALALAQRSGVTHMLFLETDCRVGCDYWDDAMFSEYFGLGRPLICGGSVAVYNPCNAGPVAAQRWGSLVAKNIRRNVPIPTYGFVSAAAKHPSFVFPNGALAIYDVAWMAKLFDLSNTCQLACATTAFDMELGKRLWPMFEADTYTVVGHLTSALSSFGEVLTTEKERLQWLREGKYVAVHQVKSGEGA